MANWWDKLTPGATTSTDSTAAAAPATTPAAAGTTPAAAAPAADGTQMACVPPQVKSADGTTCVDPPSGTGTCPDGSPVPASGVCGGSTVTQCPDGSLPPCTDPGGPPPPPPPPAGTGGSDAAITNLLSGARTPDEQAVGSYYANQMSGPATDATTIGQQYYLNQMLHPNTSVDDANLAGYKSMYANATPGEAGALSAYQGMIGKGYSPAEMNAMMQQGAQGVQGQAATARRQMMNMSQRTGNSSGLYGAMASLGANTSDQMGQFMRQNQINQANETQRRTEAGAAGELGVGAQAQAREAAGLQGSTAYANAMTQRQADAVTGGLALDKSETARRMAGASALNSYNAAGRGLTQTGLAASLQAQGMDQATALGYANVLFKYYSLPTATYQYGTNPNPGS